MLREKKAAVAGGRRHALRRHHPSAHALAKGDDAVEGADRQLSKETDALERLLALVQQLKHVGVPLRLRESERLRRRLVQLAHRAKVDDAGALGDVGGGEQVVRRLAHRRAHEVRPDALLFHLVHDELAHLLDALGVPHAAAPKLHDHARRGRRHQPGREQG